MKHRENLLDGMMAFFVCTACITMLEGVVGMLFYPEIKLGFEAFFSPPIFAFFSTLFGVVTRSKRELSVREVLIRRGIHLLLIEGLVFGVNYAFGNIYNPLESGILAVAIAVVFVAVYGVLWLNDLRSAAAFNEKLKVYQSRGL